MALSLWTAWTERLLALVRIDADDLEDDEYDMEEETPVREQEAPAAAPPIQRMPTVPRGGGDTVIWKGTSINGTLRGQGSVTVEGTVEGEIAFDGSITVSGSGVVKGPVAANILRVSGRIEGDVSAKERLVLESTGQIQGDVETVSLVIEEGGRLNGRAAMVEKPAGALQAAAPQERKAEPELLFGPNYPGGWQYMRAQAEDTEETNTAEEINEHKELQ